MKIGIVQFPGSNCARETKMAVQRIGFQAYDCYWNTPQEHLKDMDAYIIVGGFSYEDRVRSGFIASLDPFMSFIKQEAEQGKRILGICNGAQILVESGLIPNTVLTTNVRARDGQILGTGFYNNWVYIHSNDTDATARPIRIPVAHAEGRFLIEPSTYEQLIEHNALMYYYCDEKGHRETMFPTNPNGSMHNLAAVGNAQGTILAIMPHPERTPEGDGLLHHFFTRSLNAKEHSIPSTINADVAMMPYVHKKDATHYWVALSIQDNEAISLEMALQSKGLPLKLKKYIHWQIEGLNPQQEQDIRTGDDIFNPQKEYLANLEDIKGKAIYILRQKDDEIALSKSMYLQRRLGHEINVRREVVWCVECDSAVEQSIMDFLNKENIWGHPLSHEVFLYDAR